MFNQIYTHRFTIKHHQQAPLLQERIRYLKYWSDNGATRNTLRQIASCLLVIIDYLDLKNGNLVSKPEIARAAKKWAKRSYKRHNVKHRLIKSAESCFNHYAGQWLNMIGYLKLRTIKSAQFSEEISQYINHMRYERGLSEITISRRVSFAKVFCSYLIKSCNSLRKLSIAIIDDFLSHKIYVNQYSRCTIHSYTKTLRAFIKFAEQRKWCKQGLMDAIRLPRLYKDETIPYGPTWDDVKKLLARTESNCSKDIRDRAILMLLAVYGLRCSEVNQLSLNNIDWENKIIYLRRAKNAKIQEFPLCQTVGEAILRYIKKVRANKSKLQEVFISLNAPFRPLSKSAISTMVHNRLKPLNIKIKYYGAHSLRHACAIHLINEGVSLKQISDHLGHKSLDSTRIYAKVDLTTLRKVSDFNIGDLL